MVGGVGERSGWGEYRTRTAHEILFRLIVIDECNLFSCCGHLKLFSCPLSPTDRWSSDILSLLSSSYIMQLNGRQCRSVYLARAKALSARPK